MAWVKDPEGRDLRILELSEFIRDCFVVWRFSSFTRNRYRSFDIYLAERLCDEFGFDYVVSSDQ